MLLLKDQVASWPRDTEHPLDIPNSQDVPDPGPVTRYDSDLNRTLHSRHPCFSNSLLGQDRYCKGDLICYNQPSREQISQGEASQRL